MKVIKREIYIEKIVPYFNKGIIKVLTGQRRVGKSFLLRQLTDKVSATNGEANIIYINKEYERFRFIETETELFQYISEYWVTTFTSGYWINYQQHSSK